MTQPLPKARGHVFFSGDDRLEGILEWPDAAAGTGRPEGVTSAGSPTANGPDRQTAQAGADSRNAAGAQSVSAARVAGGAVVAHPHPLYGGTMAQPVVYRVAQACREQCFASLRFNFRGVGRSKGRYSGTEEYRDIEAALAYLRGRLALEPGRRPPLGLAGYSFGSVMAAVAAGAGTVPIDALALVAFVVEWEEFPARMLDGLARFRGPVLAVCGELDDLAPPAAVESTLRSLGVDFRLSVIQGTGHFFEHEQRDVGERVATFFAESLTGRWPTSN
jgi:uncharacterized protein